jgi:hypothetical protein
VPRLRNPASQGLVIIILFLEFRWRSGIWDPDRLSNARTAVFPISTSVATEARTTAGSMCDRLAAGAAGDVTGGRLAFKLRVAYTFSLHLIPFAGLARQRGPGFLFRAAG